MLSEQNTFKEVDENAKRNENGIIEAMYFPQLNAKASPARISIDAFAPALPAAARARSGR